MKEDKFFTAGRRYASWAAICVLSLLAAMVFALPSVVLAYDVVFSQDCEKALVNNEHTITATVTDGGAPVEGDALFYVISGPSAGQYLSTTTDADGVAMFPYTSVGDGEDTVQLYFNLAVIGTVTVTWTADETDPIVAGCMEPSTQTVDVEGRGKLNVKKKGAMRIMVCSDGELDLYSVVPESVTLAGVKPERWKYKDRKYCPGGKDGFVDLVFKFKNKKIVEALEGVLARELLDGEEIELDLAGVLDDETPLEGIYTVEIINKGKKKKRCKKKKMARKDR